MHVKYCVEHVRAGKVIDTFEQLNLIPEEGLNHMWDVAVHNGNKVGTWYLGIFEGNYTPVSTNTAANFPGLATECTAYTEATRPEYIEGAVSAGAVTNSASKAEYTMNADKTVYGCFLVSSNVKGGTSGTLLSAARFPVPKAILTGDILRVTSPMNLVGA